MLTNEQKLVALLEMAAEAEGLNRFAQAEHLYRRAAVVSRLTQGAESPTSLAILLDLARVCEIQNHPGDAELYYNRACAVGFFSRLTNIQQAA